MRSSASPRNMIRKASPARDAVPPQSRPITSGPGGVGAGGPPADSSGPNRAPNARGPNRHPHSLTRKTKPPLPCRHPQSQTPAPGQLPAPKILSNLPFRGISGANPAPRNSGYFTISSGLIECCAFAAPACVPCSRPGCASNRISAAPEIRTRNPLAGILEICPFVGWHSPCSVL